MAVALLVLQAATPTQALSATSVCSFGTGKLYVRDASQTAFPPGYLSCLGADSKPIARCASCKCRDKQAGTTNGLSVEWGLCVEGTEACVTAQTPDREYCGNDTESGRAFVPGTVTSAKTDATLVSMPVATTPGGVEELASGSTISNGATSGKSSTSTYIVSGCAVAGVAAVAMFAVARKRQSEPRELGTPAQDLSPAYDPTNTSKAKTLSDSTLSYKNRLSERMSGESIVNDAAFHPAHPVALPVAQPQRQAPADSMTRDSSFFGFDDDDERFTIEDGSPPEHSGFAFGKGGSSRNTTVDFGASVMTIDEFSTSSASTNFGASAMSTDFGASAASTNFGASAASTDFSATMRSDTSTRHGGDARNTSLSVESDGLPMFERDTEASEFVRESDDSVAFGASSSSLSFTIEDERSPRKSIEF